ncbi:MAG: aminopeptidase [Crocinitomicaceae bacterium]|nr:aminopeptidase [Crocinitomicaceae bacterium]|tara:strand:+ start:3280 stop:4896 length:1617 start_codon:yes stop_codon:yes gene_type:complete
MASYPKLTDEFKELGRLAPERTCFDVQHYNLEVELIPAKKVIKGEVIITSVITESTSTIRLDLHPNFEITALENVESKTAFTYERKHRSIYITLADTYEKGEKLVIRAKYNGKPPVAKKPPWRGGVVWKKDKNKNPWLGVACETDGASVWFPCKDHESDEADSIDVNVICDENLIGVSNGKLVETTTLEGNRKKYHWKTTYPINNYNITYYVGDFVEMKDTIQSLSGLVDINHYILRYNKARADTHFLEMKKHFHFYEKMFGPYSWTRDGLKMVNSPYAGMEHQTAIAYGNDFKRSWINNQDYIILHETAHEWWGNSVSVPDLAHVWIHEGFATYAEALYTEFEVGDSEMENQMWFNNWAIKNKRPVVGPENRKYFWFKDSDPYMKGAATLHTFRNMLEDDELFFDIIKSFYIENEISLVKTRDFMDHVNKKTGEDYDWFFKQYLYEFKIPILQYYISWDSKLYFRWKDCLDDFKMPVTIEINNTKYKITPTKTVNSVKLEELYGRYTYKILANRSYFGQEFMKKDDLVTEYVKLLME